MGLLEVAILPEEGLGPGHMGAASTGEGRGRRALPPSLGLEPMFPPSPAPCARAGMHSQRHTLRPVPGEKLDYKACEALEEVFKRLQFKVVDLEQTNLDEDVSSSCHALALSLIPLPL